MALQLIVASTNPVKLEATQMAFEKVFSTAIHIKGIKVDSGVKDQPLSQSETAQGAQQRVQNAQSQFPEADFWIGIEGGVHPLNDSMEAFGWVVIKHQSGQQSEARSAGFLLPPKIAAELLKGRELGPVNDEVFGKHNSKHQSGAVGLLTNDLISRAELYYQAIVMALIPFMQKELYPHPA
jgi:inosine/xanthosine triphosphatase